eukprot:769141-Rhodomonas_salina.1
MQGCKDARMQGCKAEAKGGTQAGDLASDGACEGALLPAGQERHRKQNLHDHRPRIRPRVIIRTHTRQQRHVRESVDRSLTAVWLRQHAVWRSSVRRGTPHYTRRPPCTELQVHCNEHPHGTKQVRCDSGCGCTEDICLPSTVSSI